MIEYSRNYYYNLIVAYILVNSAISRGLIENLSRTRACFKIDPFFSL